MMLLPPTTAERQADFDRHRDQLKDYIFRLLWVLDTTFPHGFEWPNPDPRVTGCTGEEPMYSLSKAIDNVLLSHDALQYAMGEEEGRFERFLHGGRRRPR